MRKQAPPPPPSDDFIVELFGVLVKGLGRAVWYIARRLWQQPIKGLLWLIWVLSIPLTLKIAWGRGTYGLTPWYADPVLVPRIEWGVGGLLLALFLVAGLDHVRTGVLCCPWPWNRPPAPPAPQPTERLQWNDRIHGQRIDRQWDPDRGDFVLKPSDDDLMFHSLAVARLSKITVGPSGCGKTYSQLLRDALWIKRTGQHGAVIDPKGLKEHEYPRRLFTHIFNPSDPDGSFRWNIYGDLPPHQAAALLAICLIPRGTTNDRAGEYFDDNAREAFRAIFVAHVEATGINTHLGHVGGEYPTVVELFDYLADKEALQRLAERLPEGSPARKDLARQIRFLGSAGDPLGTLYNKLAPLARSPAVQLLVGPGHGVSIKELVNTPGTLLGFGMNLAKQLEVGRILGRLALALWTYAILDDEVAKDHFKLMICDEARDFLSSEEDLLRGMEKARSHNAGYSLAFQSTSQLVDDRQTARFLNAAGIRIVFRNVDQLTAEVFSQNAGGAERVYHNRSISTSTGHSLGRSSGSSTVGGSLGSGGQSQASGRQTGTSISESNGYSESRQFRRDWLPVEIQHIPERHALISINRTIPDPHRPYDSTARRNDIALVDLTDSLLLPFEAKQDFIAAWEAPALPRLPNASALKKTELAVQTIRDQLRDLAAKWAALHAANPTDVVSRRQREAQEARIEHLVALLQHYLDPTPATHARVQALYRRSQEAAAAWQEAERQRTARARLREPGPISGASAPPEPFPDTPTDDQENDRLSCEVASPPQNPLSSGASTPWRPPPANQAAEGAGKAGEV